MSTHPGHPRPTRDPPTDGKISRGGCRPPDPPGLRLRAMMPMADALKIYSRSNGHNSLQFRPLSTKIWPNYTKFRDATREATPEAAAPQIRPVSVFSHETPSVSSFFDETWCGKKSSPRRICMQSLGRIRAKVVNKSDFSTKNTDFSSIHICIYSLLSHFFELLGPPSPPWS